MKALAAIIGILVSSEFARADASLRYKCHLFYQRAIEVTRSDSYGLRPIENAKVEQALRMIEDTPSVSIEELQSDTLQLISASLKSDREMEDAIRASLELENSVSRCSLGRANLMGSLLQYATANRKEAEKIGVMGSLLKTISSSQDSSPLHVHVLLSSSRKIAALDFMRFTELERQKIQEFLQQSGSVSLGALFRSKSNLKLVDVIKFRLKQKKAAKVILTELKQILKSKSEQSTF